MSLIQDLNWRFAAKYMNGETVEDNKIQNILESIRLAPTSIGLQAFKVIIITDKSTKLEIFEKAATRQRMIPDCSHLLVFATYTKITENDLDTYLNLIKELRNTPSEGLTKIKESYGNYILSLPQENMIKWTTSQTYIAMAYATIAAANEKVDSTPIEGFDSKIVNSILGLDELNLSSTLLLPLGYRDAERDRLVDEVKVRKDFKDLFIFK